LGTIGVQAAPVVYTLQTVGDGKLGSHPFAEALIRIVQTSDTSQVVATPSGRVQLFVSTTGSGGETIKQNGKSVVANSQPIQLYLFYDTGKGIAGFGSAISPTYPVALDCNNTTFNGTPYTADCQVGNAVNFNTSNTGPSYGDRDGTLSALYLGSTEFTPQTLALPKSLAQSTLLTGHVHMCAVSYTVGNFGNTFEDLGDLGTCGGPAPAGHTLMTDHGGFSLQDMVGGSNSGVGPFGWGGWDTSNVGYLSVSAPDVDD
jgi:hypothetical protein